MLIAASVLIVIGQMLYFSFRPQHLLGPVIVLIVMSIMALFHDQVVDALAFQRPDIEAKRFWSLVTGSFLHTNLNHFLLNTLGITLLWAVHGCHYQVKRYLLLVLLTALATTLGVYFFAPRLEWYVGMSGALHGVFVWGACKDIESGEKTGWLLLAGAAVKILAEHLMGAPDLLADLIDANVAYEAHLFGAVAGLMIYVLPKLTSTRAKSPR